MSVLVTGAAGFIGYHVSRRLLEDGEHVIGIDNLNDYYDPELKEARLAELSRMGTGRFDFRRLNFAHGEMLDEALSSLEFGRIVHLGAQAGVRYSLEKPRAYITANVMGHLNILELARRRAVSNFVYASSSSVYGGNTKLPFGIGDRVDHPISLYAATKKADELMSEAYAHLYRTPMIGLRFFTVYGPWGRPDMAMWIFTQKILAGETIQMFNHGRMRRDFTYIDDIVDGVIAALEMAPRDDGSMKAGGSFAPHALYNLGNSRSEMLTTMVAIIEAECGKKAVMELLDMPPGDIPETYADIGVAETELGFSPTTSIQQGIPRFVSWFRQYHGISSR